MYKTWVLLVCLFLGYAPRALIIWCFTNLITWKITWQFIIQLFFPGFGFIFLGGFFLGWKPYMLALVGQPSLHGYYACMVFWNKGALWRNCRLKKCKTSFSPCCVFLCSRYSLKRWWEEGALVVVGWEGSSPWSFFRVHVR